MRAFQSRSRKIRVVAAAAALLAGCAVVPVRAQETAAPAAPDAATVLARYVDATGGRAAHEKIRNRVTHATLEIVGAGVALDVRTWSARPDKVYALIESDAIGRIERGTDGTVAWETSVATGPRLIEGGEKAQFMREAAFDGISRWQDLYASAENRGEADVDGKSCWKVVMTPKEGDPETLYFDRESGLMVRRDSVVDSPMGKLPVVSRVEDYRDVDGLRYPFRVRASVMQQDRVVTVQSIEHDVDLPPDRFALPSAIRELLAPAKGDESGPKG